MNRWLALLLMTGAISASASTQGSALSQLQWKYRVIAVFARAAAEADHAENKLRGERAGIYERDLAWFVVSPADVRSNTTIKIKRQSLAELHATKAFEAILLGKDGGIKARQDGTLHVQAFFNAIDRMPIANGRCGTDYGTVYLRPNQPKTKQISS